MKKLLIMSALLFTFGISYASEKGLFTGRNAYPVKVTVSSATSTTLFTDEGGIEEVQFDTVNCSADIYLSSFSITATTTTPVTTGYINIRKVKAGQWPPLSIKNKNYRFAISSAATPSLSDFYIDVIK